MRVSAIGSIRSVGFNNSQPIEPKEKPVEETETDYKYPDRPGLLKRIWNALRSEDEVDMRIEQLDYVA